jgi:3-deoxy-manno-octulosonate cytidylyltransferase (CMP-KDO synthetase)
MSSPASRTSTRRTIAVIPARLQSTRLPRKMLLADTGKPLIQHVYEAVKRVAAFDRVLIAVDDAEVEQACRAFGAEVRMTDPAIPSGTDRVAAALASDDGAHRHADDVIVNVQGDEPEIDPVTLERLVARMHAAPQPQIGSLCWAADRAIATDPNTVKVVLSADGHALYFSRAPVPYDRDKTGSIQYTKHVGVYAFRRSVLGELTRLPVSPLEQAERLEQLRWLEAGYRIAMVPAATDTAGIDTREGYDAFVARLRAR